MALFSLTTNAYINQPPTQIGDGSATTNYGEVYTFTIEDFTTNTVPAYSDPEGDAAENLKILTLPATGELQFNALPVIINQIISFTDIGTGLFTFVPDNGTTITYIDIFTYEISDVGSGQYIS